MIQPQDISLPLKPSLIGGMFTDETIGNAIPLKEIERHHIVGVLKSLNGNKPEVAKVLGLSLKTLYTKILRYQIQVD